MSSLSPANLIQSLKPYAETEIRSEIKLGANGGNSILVAVPPKMEHAYIKEMHKQFTSDVYSLIDLNELLITFCSKHNEGMFDLFELLSTSPEQIFKAPPGEDSEDLFSLIIEAIKSAYNDGKVPVLYNTGSLYGTGIDNIHIMEHDTVMSSSLPLFVIYPALRKNDKLLYLGARIASKYRCLVIEA